MKHGKGEWTPIGPVGSCGKGHRCVEMMDDEAGLWIRCLECGGEPRLIRERTQPIPQDRKPFEPLWDPVDEWNAQMDCDAPLGPRLADIGIECPNGCGPVIASRCCPGCGRVAKRAA